MQFTRIIFSLTLALVVAANCQAQDDASPKAKKAAERAVKNTTEQMMKNFAPAKLTDEQIEKAKQIIKQHVPKIMAARKAQNSMLSDEQKKKRIAAMKKAREAGVKGNKVAAEANKAMGLSDEEMKKYNEGNKKVAQANAKMKAAIGELLTDEQKAAMPKPKGKRGKGKGKRKGKGNQSFL